VCGELTFTDWGQREGSLFGGAPELASLCNALTSAIDAMELEEAAEMAANGLSRPVEETAHPGGAGAELYVLPGGRVSDHPAAEAMGVIARWCTPRLYRATALARLGEFDAALIDTLAVLDRQPTNAYASRLRTRLLRCLDLGSEHGQALLPATPDGSCRHARRRPQQHSCAISAGSLSALADEAHRNTPWNQPRLSDAEHTSGGDETVTATVQL
jgi:hypothetical protein